MAGKRSPEPPSIAHGWYALTLLFIVALFNYVDRSLLSILQVPLKKELALSDSEIGLLTGLAFALVYTTLALPVARLADTRARKFVLAVALAIWTGMTALSGFANSFLTLLACRLGVAVGEAGSVSPSLSLLADYFPRHRRATVMGLWGLSLSLGVMLSFGVGGSLAATLGWRGTFFAVGLAGLTLPPVILLTLREPPRGRYDGVAKDHALPSIGDSFALLWNLRSFRYICMAEALQAYVQLSLSTWGAAFYSRVHHLPLRQIAVYMALNTGLAGAMGTVLGTLLVTRLGRFGQSWYLRVPGCAAFLIVPFGLVQFFAPNVSLSLLFGAVPPMMAAVYIAPVNAVQQSLVPANLRAFTTSVLAFVVNFVGLGMGPLVTGIVSDVLINRFGLANDSLRYAIPLQLLAALGAGYLFFEAASFLSSELLSPLHECEDQGTLEPPVAAQGE